jgi:hypothetical protein
VLAFITWGLTHSLLLTSIILITGTLIETYIGLTRDKSPFRAH